nr:hypothetical protein [uncultured Flavobacterium sp.]
MGKNITFDFTEINTLNKLLDRIKFEPHLDAEDLSSIASSPYITSIYEKVHLAYREHLSGNPELLEEIYVDGKSRFKLSEKNGIEDLKKRIHSLTGNSILYIKGMNTEELDLYCDEIFAPFIPTKKQKEEILNLLIEIKKSN